MANSRADEFRRVPDAELLEMRKAFLDQVKKRIKHKPLIDGTEKENLEFLSNNTVTACGTLNDWLKLFDPIFEVLNCRTEAAVIASVRDKLFILARNLDRETKHD